MLSVGGWLFGRTGDRKGRRFPMPELTLIGGKLPAVPVIVVPEFLPTSAQMRE